MVELSLNPSKPNWFSSEDGSYLSTETIHLQLVTRPHFWRPATDVFETEQAIIIRVEIAGVREEDFTITLEDRTVVIRGMRLDTSERRAYYQMEIPYGEFASEVELPTSVDMDKVEANYQDGFLRIVLPKVRSTRIHIEE